MDMTQRQQDLWLTPEGEAELMQRHCLKRKLMPDDIARVVLFFAAADSGACTTARRPVTDATATSRRAHESHAH
jgi:hypothetical protein